MYKGLKIVFLREESCIGTTTAARFLVELLEANDSPAVLIDRDVLLFGNIRSLPSKNVIVDTDVRPYYAYEYRQQGFTSISICKDAEKSVADYPIVADSISDMYSQLCMVLYLITE